MIEIAMTHNPVPSIYIGLREGEREVQQYRQNDHLIYYYLAFQIFY